MIAIFAACSGGLLLSYYWLFVSIPRCRASVFRYSLWRMRDEVVDRLISRDLAFTPEIINYLNAVEIAIQHVHILTPLRLLGVRMVIWANRVFGKSSAAVSAAVPRNNAADYEIAYGKALLDHVLTGSPSGWLCWIVLRGLIPIAKVSAAPQRILNRTSKAVLDLLSRMPPTTGGQRPLSTCV